MLVKFSGHEFEMRSCRFAEEETVNNDYLSLTFIDDTTPELKGQNLVIGDFKFSEKEDEEGMMAFDAFFSDNPESDAMVNQHGELINSIVYDIITKAVENQEKNNVTN